MSELVWDTIAELGPRLRRRQVSAEELARAAIARTEKLEPLLNSYIRFLPEQALAQARQVDEEIARGDYRGPLHGIPISLKDLFDVAGIPTSGGSGAQVAAGLAALSVGSDNGGSVRIPAAVCGIVGLKPTHGRVSMEGMFPRAYTFDHPGPLTRTVEDCAIALQVLAGHDRGDSTTIAKPVPDYREGLKAPVKGVRVGVDRAFVRVGQPQVRAAFDTALAQLAGLGLSVREVRLPAAEEINPLFGTLFFPEWGAAHEPWLRSHPEEYPVEWAARSALLIPAVEYVKASRKRRLLQLEWARATSDVNLVASPTYPLDRRPFGDYPVIEGKQLTFDDALRYTMPFDLLGLPAISLPCGFSNQGFPIGLQLVGRAFDEPTVLSTAYAYEQASEWHRRHPPP